MNKQPTVYRQIDNRWKNLRITTKVGGSMSLGAGGCGPTCAAMAIDSLVDRQVLPTETFEWGCKNGYVVGGQGTYYSYFVPQFAKFGIRCEVVNTDDARYENHVTTRRKVIRMLEEGYWIIALMREGLWTSSGHFVLVWWNGDKIEINDPASTLSARNHGDPDLFFSQAKRFWAIDARAYNRQKEDEEMAEAIYNTIADLEKFAPWSVDTVKRLCDAKFLQGSDDSKDKDGYPASLNLNNTMLRMLVVNDRAGLYNSKTKKK